MDRRAQRRAGERVGRQGRPAGHGVLRGGSPPRAVRERRACPARWRRLPVPHVRVRARRQAQERAGAARSGCARDAHRRRLRRRRFQAIPHRRPREGGDVSLLTRLGDFIDERTGPRQLLTHTLDEPVRGGARWAYVFGSALLGSFLVQVVTGVALMTSYAPSDKTAWASVHYITFTQSGGWLVRGLHHFGAQAMVILLAGHLLQVALYGGYKKPREVTW